MTLRYLPYSDLCCLFIHLRKLGGISYSLQHKNSKMLKESKAGRLIQKGECFKNRASKYKGLAVASPVSTARPLYHGNGMPVGSSMWV